MARQIKFCSIDGCPARSYAKGMCDRHYYRGIKYGNPTEPPHILKPFTGENPVEHFWSKVALTADPEKCWKWERNLSRDGYGLARLNNKTCRAHRVAWFLANGRMPIGLVLHSCDDRTCVNPNHLREGTEKDNAADMVARNRQIRGERHSQAKLSVEKVRQIKNLLSDGMSQRAVARQFGVSQHTVNQINIGGTWSWV